MSTVFILLFVFFLCKTKATQITPTISNSTGQYFISNTSGQWKNSIITCNHSSLCYFGCNDGSSCLYTTFITSSITTQMTCYAYYSCSGITLDVPGNDISIYCGGYAACYELSFQNAENVNIYCSGDYSCAGSFYCPSHSENVCNVVCDGDFSNSTSCYFLNFMVPNNYHLNWLNLTFTNPASPGTFQSGTNYVIVYCINESVLARILPYNGESVCIYSHCCPYSKVEYEYCVDSYNKECIIDCTSQTLTTKILSPCGYSIINASDSTSLSVLCPEPNSCTYLNIICPINGDDCNITSSDHHAAMYMHIIAGNNNNININCYGSQSCYDLIIESASNNNYNIHVACTGTESCRYAHFELANNSNFNILCDGRHSRFFETGACRDVYINALNANNIYIECRFDGNCYSINVHAERSNELDIICDNGGSCRNISIYPPTNIQDIFSLECYNGLFDYSCDAIYIIIENSFVPHFMDLLCDTATSCNYIEFQFGPQMFIPIDTEYGTYLQFWYTGYSSLNMGENNEITCSDDDFCPLQGTTSPTTPIPTKKPTEYPTQSHNVYSSTSSNVPSSNNQITATNMIQTTNDNKTDSKSSNDSGLGTAWIILIVVCVLVALIFAIYISFKIGERSAFKKHVKSFELISESQPNNNQLNQQNTSTD